MGAGIRLIAIPLLENLSPDSPGFIVGPVNASDRQTDARTQCSVFRVIDRFGQSPKLATLPREFGNEFRALRWVPRL